MVMLKGKRRKEDGVSPVVGVMLMLVVTIIIAAVVSGFAGGLMGSNNQKTPMLSMDVKITNTGIYTGSGFTATVTAVSEPIATKNLKIVTSWSASDPDGNPVMGGGTVIGQQVNLYADNSGGSTKILLPPYGFGAGVDNSSIFEPYSDEQAFGFFTMMQGTGLIATPSGKDYPGSYDYGYGVIDRYEYLNDTSEATGSTGIDVDIGSAGKTGKMDPMQAILGYGWQNLDAGDVVQVNVIYVPTGKVILSKSVAVGV